MSNIEAILDPSGSVQFTKPFKVSSPTRILVTVLPEGIDAEVYQDTIRQSSMPEAREQREKALADYRAGKVFSTPDAIRYFESLIQDPNQP